MNEIPLGKQLKYALQEKEALKEDVKEWFNLTVEQQRQLSMDFARATAEVSELQYKLAEEVSIQQMIEQEEELRIDISRQDRSDTIFVLMALPRIHWADDKIPNIMAHMLMDSSHIQAKN